MIGDPAIFPALLIMGAAVLAALSGAPMLLRSLSPTTGQRIAALVMTVAALGGISGAVATLLTRRQSMFQFTWPFPFSPTEWGVDPLTAFFTLPILIVSLCCSIYGLGYWPAGKHPRTARKLTFFFGLLVSSMLFVTMARSAGLFIVTWEVMALAAYFLLTTDDHVPEVRDAGTLYMICTHSGTLILFALFALLNNLAGTFLFPAAGSLAAATPFGTAVFVSALFGFGFKAGVMPLHIWLPSAHANAPSHISAIMSGVILKIGIYGLLRVLSFFSGIPLWWGVLLLTIGMISGVVGVLFALGQHDLKRLLAYHSIENIGIIVMGIGVALIGVTSESPLLVLLGLSGALLHVLNHATFKALLFLSAGSVIHAIATREIERMGGLLRYLPWTGLSFIIGSVAICGLPPLNGFISELLLYLGFFNGAVHGNGTTAISAALAAPVLALIGGLAVACFVKVVGVVFLGAPRTPLPPTLHEAPVSMKLPLGILAGVCLFIGIVPLAVAPLLDGAVSVWQPRGPSLPPLSTIVPLGWISLCALFLVGLGAGLLYWYRRRLGTTTIASDATWGCGYLAPTTRMQYSASSFADMLVSLFAGILRPERHRPRIRGMFPRGSRFGSHVPEAILERLFVPMLEALHQKLLPIRKLQHGHLHLYILYTFVTLVVLIVVSLP